MSNLPDMNDRWDNLFKLMQQEGDPAVREFFKLWLLQYPDVRFDFYTCEIEPDHPNVDVWVNYKYNSEEVYGEEGWYYYLMDKYPDVDVDIFQKYTGPEDQVAAATKDMQYLDEIKTKFNVEVKLNGNVLSSIFSPDRFISLMLSEDGSNVDILDEYRYE